MALTVKKISELTNASAPTGAEEWHGTQSGASVAISVSQVRRRNWTATKTGAYTAAVWEIVKYDPSGGTFTITMPSAPTAGDTVTIKNTTGDTTAITVDGNGSDIEDPTASTYTTAATASVSTDGGAITWSYDGSVWQVI